MKKNELIKKSLPSDVKASRSVFELTTDLRFLSVSEAAKYFGISPSTVKKVCDGKNYETKDGYRFCYAD